MTSALDAPPDGPPQQAKTRASTVVLGRTRHIQANAHLLPGTTLVVTFASRARPEARIWGQSPLAAHGVSTIGFGDFGDAFYPEPEMAELVGGMRDILARYERIVTYGLSMGAYGALKYGRLLGAGRSVGLAPIYSIARAEAPFNMRRVKAYYRPLLHDGMAVRPEDCAQDVVGVLDPRHPDDRGQFDAIVRAGCDVALAPCHFLRHGVMSSLLDAGLAGAFAREVAFGDGPAGLRSLLRRSRAASPRYVAAALRGLRSGGHETLRSRLATVYATPFRHTEAVRSALDGVDGERTGDDDALLFPGEAGWESFFHHAPEPVVALAVTDAPFETFFRFAAARRWIAVHAKVGEYERVEAFLKVYAPRIAHRPRLLGALAKAIAVNGATDRRYELARPLAESAEAAGVPGAHNLARAARLAVEGSVSLPAASFNAPHGAFADGCWTLSIPRPGAEVARSAPILLPPGRFEVTLLVDGGWNARRSLAPQVIPVKLGVLEREPVPKAGLPARFGLAPASTTIRIRDRSHRHAEQVYVVARGRLLASPSVSFRGAEITRA